MRIQVLLDTGDALVFDGVDPEIETVDSYVEGFNSKAPSVSFQTSADEWTVIPAHRIVAIRARPDDVILSTGITADDDIGPSVAELLRP